MPHLTASLSPKCPPPRPENKCVSEMRPTTTCECTLKGNAAENHRKSGTLRTSFHAKQPASGSTARRNTQPYLYSVLLQSRKCQRPTNAI
eukprot:708686-Pleurochrysis_carterae.AAC.1